MSFKALNFRIGCALALFAGCAWADGILRAADGPVPQDRLIHFSEPKDGSAGTNLNPLTGRVTSKTPDDFYKPEAPFASPGSLDGVMVGQFPRPAGVTVIQSRRAKELEDRRKNWAFLEPEELSPAVTAEELLNIPDSGVHGNGKDSPSALERFLSYSRRGATNVFRSGDFTGSRSWDDETGPEHPNSIANAFGNSGQRLKNFSESASNSRLLPSTENRFGNNDDLETERMRREQQARLDQFKQMMNTPMQPAPAFNATLNPMNGTPDSSRQASGFGDWSVFSSPGKDITFDPLFGTVSPVLAPVTPSFLNAEVLAVPGFTPVLPTPTPTRQIPQPAPAFSVPQRKF
jgi:hypothetical protein